MQESPSFFESIINPNQYENIDSVIVVIHANVDIDNFLKAVSGISRIAGVIPKKSSPRQNFSPS